MKRALLVLSLGLSACTPDFLQSGRYACSPDGGADQCPGAWRCGLEEYCHQLGDTAVAWKCHDDTDCEGNFVCGITKSGEFRECHDPGKPQDWPCAVATDCVAGWKCGWASATTQQCHDPAAPQAWVCKVPDDCLGGWSCGLSTGGESRQCHDPAAPKTFWCESNADCVAGWQCGLASSRDHGECHDPANPRAFACDAETDCLAGWRCGTEGLCVNPAADALGTTPAVSIDGGVHLNSLVSRSPITLLSVSPIDGQSGRGNAAFVQDGHLRATSLNTVTGRVTEYDLGTNVPVAVVAEGAHGLDYDGNPDQLERVMAAWPDGGRTIFTFADGGLLHSIDDGFTDLFGDPLVFPVDNFAHGTAAGDILPSVLGFPSALPFSNSPSDIYVITRGEFSVATALATESDQDDFGTVQNNHIRAMASLQHTDAETNSLQCVYLVDDRGLWVSQRTDQYHSDSTFRFEPVSIDRFSHLSCGTGAQPRITSVSSVTDHWLAVTAQTPTGPVQVALLDATRTWTIHGNMMGNVDHYCVPNTYYAACDAADRVPVDVAWGPCVACPGGTTFEGMNTVLGVPGSEPSLEVLCGEPNTPGSVFRISRTGATSSCTRTQVSGESSFFSERGPVAGVVSAGQVAWGGSAGQIWFGANSAGIASITFDRAPTGVVRWGAAPDAIIAFTPQLLGTPSAGLGLSSIRPSLLSAGVRYAPSLALWDGQLVDLAGTATVADSRPLGFFASGALDAPAAVLTRSSVGRRIAVISSGATVYVGDVEDVLDASGSPIAFSQRLNTGEPISSLSFPETQTPDGGAYASGYAVAGSNLVRVVADSPSRWRTEAVPLPASVVPRSTWFDGTKGRVGFYDGSVFSLPSRVRISSPLPGNDAEDYAQACGQQLALAPDGLYRLESVTTGPIGQWVKIPLPSEVASLDFTEGRVHGVGNEAYVFTRSGEAARITFESCPP